MDEQTFKKLLNQALKPIIKRLDDPKTGLVAINNRLDDPKTGLRRINEKIDVLWDQVERVTFGMDNAKETLDSHTTYLRNIETKVEKSSDDTGKLDKRLSEVEGHVGIAPPPELTLIR